MIPASLLAQTLTLARRFTPTVIAATPGRVIARGAGTWIELASSQVVDTFQCRDLPGLAIFLKGLRGMVSVERGTLLAARGRRLAVAQSSTIPWDPGVGSAFSIPISGPRLRSAVERFGRKDAECLLHYTHDALYLDDDKGFSPISDHRRSAGPTRIARAVSGQQLRRALLTLRTNDIDARILGEWNGAGPIVLSECDETDNARLSIVVQGGSYKSVRHLLLRVQKRPQPEPSIYTGLTQQECEDTASSVERERAKEWVEMRQWYLHRLHELQDNPEARGEQAALIERLDREAQTHRRPFGGGCGIPACDVCRRSPTGCRSSTAAQ